jgi:hypothetical protein
MQATQRNVATRFAILHSIRFDVNTLSRVLKLTKLQAAIGVLLL